MDPILATPEQKCDSWQPVQLCSDFERATLNPRTSQEMRVFPGLGRSSGGGHGSPLQYSCLENPMDRGDWWATVHRVTQSHTTEQLSMHSEPQCECGCSFCLQPPAHTLSFSLCIPVWKQHPSGPLCRGLTPCGP